MTRAVVVLALLAVGGRALPAQGPSLRPAWRSGVSAVWQTRFLADVNGPTVTGGRTLAVEGGPVWTLVRADRFGLHLKGALQVRAAFPRVLIAERSDTIGPPRSGGRASLVDVGVRVEQELDTYLQYHVAASALFVRGPRDIAPFRFAGVNGRHASAEVGAALQLACSRTWLTAALHISELGSRDPEAEITEGPFLRALVGLRRGR